MPSSQTAATERRNERIVTHEPPKLKTTLKTPPKQATNPLQFVKVGPCSLYRTAQEQLQKVQEVKKIKQEVRDDPEDWQSNLDNWKSSRRKRQEHIIERVVEVKKLELEEHDRQRRRSKTFSEMMEERGSRGRKLSMSLAMYHEEDANDLSDLGIGTSSGKSSVSGDTHDDTQSVLSDRDSEIEKNHSDLESVANENGNTSENQTESDETAATDTSSRTILSGSSVAKKPSAFVERLNNDNETRVYDPTMPATSSSPEPEEYTYEGAIRGYVSRVTQNIPRRSLVSIDAKLDNANSNDNDETGSDEKNSSVPVVKVDVLKRREIFEKASQIKTETRANNKNNNNSNNNNNINNCARSSGDQPSTRSIKERLSSLEKQSSDVESLDKDAKAMKRLSGDMSSIRERFSHLEKQTSERESKVSSRETSSADLESSRRLSSVDKYVGAAGSETTKSGAVGHSTTFSQNGDGIAASMFKDRLVRLDTTVKSKEPLANKKNLQGSPLDKQLIRFINEENSTPSERSSSPDSEYRVPRAAFHRSLDSLDADASSGPDTFERVQSLEELDYSNRYPPSSSSAELLNDTDREDSGIHTADVSCSVSQADEPVEEELVNQPETIVERQETNLDDNETIDSKETNVQENNDESKIAEVAESCTRAIAVDGTQHPETSAVTTKDTADACSSTTGTLSNKKCSPSTGLTSSIRCNAINERGARPIVYQSPRIPPRRAPPESPKDNVQDGPLLDANTGEKTNSTSSNGSFNPKNWTEPQRCRPDQTTLEIPRADIEDISGHPTVGKSPSSAQDAKRSASKIPTPLPRKSLSVKNVPGPFSPPAKVSQQPKSPIKPSGIAHSKIPFSTVTSQSTKLPDESGLTDKRQPERRRTVVELCEKVLVSQDETPSSPPVTPFITVLRIGKERSNEVRTGDDQTREGPSRKC